MAISKRVKLNPLRKFKTSHPDWQCTIVTFDKTGTFDTDKEPISAIPIWQWLLS